MFRYYNSFEYEKDDFPETDMQCCHVNCDRTFNNKIITMYNVNKTFNDFIKPYSRTVIFIFDSK